MYPEPPYILLGEWNNHINFVPTRTVENSKQKDFLKRGYILLASNKFFDDSPKKD